MEGKQLRTGLIHQQFTTTETDTFQPFLSQPKTSFLDPDSPPYRRLDLLLYPKVIPCIYIAIELLFRAHCWSRRFRQSIEMLRILQYDAALSSVTHWDMIILYIVPRAGRTRRGAPYASRL